MHFFIKRIINVDKTLWFLSVISLPLLMIREFRPLGIPLTQIFLILSMIINVKVIVLRKFYSIEISFIYLYIFFIAISFLDLLRDAGGNENLYVFKLTLLFLSLIGYVTLIEKYGYSFFIKYLILSSTFLLLILIYKSLFVLNTNWLAIHPSIPTRSGKNQLAFFLSFILPLLIWNYVNYKKFFINKWFYIAFIIIHFFSALFVQSRGLLFSFVISLLITSLVYKNILIVNIKRILIFAVVCISGFYLVVSLKLIDLTYFIQKVKSVFGGNDNQISTKIRKELITESLDIFMQNPIFGIGTNNFAETIGKATHNTYLQITAENGILGIFIILSFLILLFIKMLHYREKSPIYYTSVHIYWNLVVYLFVINGFFNVISVVGVSIIILFERYKLGIKSNVGFSND